MAVPASLHPAAYVWQQHAESSYRRLPLSSESLWASKPRNARHIFITADLTLQRPLRILDTLEVAREAWRRLSYEIPELRLSSVSEKEETYLQYDCPQYDGEVKTWAKRTLNVESSPEVPDFERLRDLLLKKNGELTYPASLLLHFQDDKEKEETHSSKFWCVLNTDHLITDGIGTRILLGDFLNIFSSILDSGAPHIGSIVYLWERSGENLSPPWICIMNDKQRHKEKEFEDRVASNQEYLLHTQVPTISLE
jgi:hypothetical protein